jgi:hypothetical protein
MPMAVDAPRACGSLAADAVAAALAKTLDLFPAGGSSKDDDTSAAPPASAPPAHLRVGGRAPGRRRDGGRDGRAPGRQRGDVNGRGGARGATAPRRRGG